MKEAAKLAAGFLSHQHGSRISIACFPGRASVGACDLGRLGCDPGRGAVNIAEGTAENQNASVQRAARNLAATLPSIAVGGGDSKEVVGDEEGARRLGGSVGLREGSVVGSTGGNADSLGQETGIVVQLNEWSCSTGEETPRVERPGSGKRREDRATGGNREGERRGRFLGKHPGLLGTAETAEVDKVAQVMDALVLVDPDLGVGIEVVGTFQDFEAIVVELAVEGFVG